MTLARQAEGGQAAGPVLIFDSGLGGMTVLRHVVKMLPRAGLVYCADNAGFPYGVWEEQALVSRIVGLIGSLVERVHPSAIVVACNTATTIAIDALRAAYTETGPEIPIVGTVPAIKVAAKISKTRVFSVLATPGTVRRDYTKALIAAFAGDCHVTLSGIDELAVLAEDRMHGQAVDIDHLASLIAPAFVEKDGKRTDTLVLGCTHYPLIEKELGEAASWPVQFVDPGAAIARRLVDVVQDCRLRRVDENGHDLIVTGPSLDRDSLADLAVYGIRRQFVHHFDWALNPCK